jgi:hypothetical protein
MTVSSVSQGDWIPAACTLPTTEQPLRRREFDALFSEGVLAVVEESPTRLRLDLRPDAGVAGRTAALAVRETGCCSFFTFDLTITDGSVALVVSAPAHPDLLAALRAHAEACVGPTS